MDITHKMQFKQQDPTQIQESDFTNTKITGDLRAFMYFIKISYEHDNVKYLWYGYDNTFGGGYCGPITREKDGVHDYKTFQSHMVNRMSKECNKMVIFRGVAKDGMFMEIEFEYVPPQVKRKNDHERCTIQ